MHEQFYEWKYYRLGPLAFGVRKKRYRITKAEFIVLPLELVPTESFGCVEVVGKVESFTALDEFNPLGAIRLLEGFEWEPSGPSIHTEAMVEGSKVHDALYRAMREGKLSAGKRKHADRIFISRCVAHGMWTIRAWWVYLTVRIFAGRCARK